MRTVVLFVTLLAMAAPCARADIPSPEPVGKRTTVIWIAAGTAIGAALFAFSRIVRRRPEA